MCLRTFQSKQQTAEQGKTAYKIVVKRDGQFFTPYVDEPIPMEAINGQKAFKAKGKTLKLRDGLGYAIEGGNIHTYATASEAFFIAESFTRQYGTPFVFECVIPKGTKYYYGFGYGRTHEYASKQIRFVKPLENPLLNNVPLQLEIKFC